VELVGVGLVFVGHDGVEDVHIFADEGELGADGGGIFGAFLDFGGVVLVDLVQGVAVLAEAVDEAGVDLELEGIEHAGPRDAVGALPGG
jgi:hypothetical protein